jgi:hypothetical protein
MEKKDSDWAFPGTDYFGKLTSGMILRDWFAGQALAGLAERIKPDSGDADIQELAWAAYCVADAMLDEREVEK